MKQFMKNKKQNGYAVLFAMLIIGSLSVIIAGISNTALKQTVLSSLSKDSLIAFYQSDIALDCALYADLVKEGSFGSNVTTWSCGANDLTITPITDGNGSYKLEPPDPDSNNPCFHIIVNKENVNGTIKTDNIEALGYNICDKSNPRVVERSIFVQYD